MKTEEQIEYLMEKLVNPKPPEDPLKPTKDGKFYAILCFDEEFESNFAAQRRLDHLSLIVASAGYKFDNVDYGKGTLSVNDANHWMDIDNRRMNKAVFYFAKNQ